MGETGKGGGAAPRRERGGIAARVGRFGLDSWRAPDVVGFATHWTWIWCVFWSSLFYDTAPADAPAWGDASAAVPALEPLWLVSLAANVITIALLLLLARMRNPLADVRGLPWAAAGLTAVGTLLLTQAAVDLLGPAAPAAYLLGGVLTGVGSGAVVVLWAEQLASIGSMQTIAFSIAALLVAAAAYALIALLPVRLAQLLVVLLPVANVMFYLHLKEGMPRVPRSASNVLVNARPPLRMMLIALFFGLSFGAMKGLMTPMAPSWIGLRDALNIVAIVVGVLALYVTTSVCKMDFNQLTYQVALPLMAAGFLFLPLHEPYSVIGTAVYQCGYQYFYIALWSTWAIIASRGGVPAGWVVAWGMLSIQAGQLAGSIAAAFAAGTIQDDLGKAMLSATAVFVMLLVALFAFGNKTPETGWGFVRPAETPSQNSPLDDAATRLARRFRLSPREIEVFFLLAKGHTRAHIASELSIGDETVKSHVKSLYRKMGLHSQQELIDLVEQESA